MGERIGKIKLEESLILELLDFEGGRILRAQTDVVGNVELTLMHDDLPETESEEIPYLVPEYFEVRSQVRGYYTERVWPHKTYPSPMIVPPGYVPVEQSKLDEMAESTHMPIYSNPYARGFQVLTDDEEGSFQVQELGVEGLHKTLAEVLGEPESLFEEQYENAQFAQDEDIDNTPPDAAELIDE